MFLTGQNCHILNGMETTFYCILNYMDMSTMMDNGFRIEYIRFIFGLDFTIKVPHIYLTHYYTLSHYAEVRICSKDQLCLLL